MVEYHSLCGAKARGMVCNSELAPGKTLWCMLRSHGWEGSSYFLSTVFWWEHSQPLIGLEGCWVTCMSFRASSLSAHQQCFVLCQKGSLSQKPLQNHYSLLASAATAGTGQESKLNFLMYLVWLQFWAGKHLPISGIMTSSAVWLNKSVCCLSLISYFERFYLLAKCLRKV